MLQHVNIYIIIYNHAPVLTLIYNYNSIVSECIVHNGFFLIVLNNISTQINDEVAQLSH